MRYKTMLMVVIFFFAAGIWQHAAAKNLIYAPVNKSLQIIDCETDIVIKKISYDDYIFNAAFSPDKKRYYMNAFHSVYVVDTADEAIADIYKFADNINIINLAVSNDSSKLYLLYFEDKYPVDTKLMVYDTKRREIIKRRALPRCITFVITLRNNNRQVIIGGMDFYKLDIKSGKREKIFGMFNTEKGVERKNNLIIWNNSSPGDHGIFSTPYYTRRNSMGYLLINTNNGKIRNIKGKDIFSQYSTIVSPNKKYLYGVMGDMVKIDLKTGRTVNLVTLRNKNGYSLCMTSDGKKIYTGPAGNTITVFDAFSFERIAVIELDAEGTVAHRITF